MDNKHWETHSKINNQGTRHSICDPFKRQITKLDFPLKEKLSTNITASKQE